MKVFVEEQRFNQWWLYVILAIPFLTLVIPYIVNVDRYVNSDQESLISVFISLIILSIVVILILLIRLKTKIDENGIYYQFYPINFNEKFIPWSDISKCYIRKYRPLTEYGGWGYKTSPFGRGRVLNIKGNMGIQLEFNNGKKLLLGTQKQNEVEKVLLTYKYKVDYDEN